MAQYFFGMSQAEKNNILDQHKSTYDGYVTQYGQGNNQQPLYVQDFANDKDGMVVNNKGEVKKYTNMGINESDLPLDMIGDGEDDLINGTVDIDDETRWEDEDIEYISLGLKEDDDMDDYENLYPSYNSNGDFLGMVEPSGDMENFDLEEGWDDHRMKRRYDDYNPEKFKKMPKLYEPGMSDFEGTELMGNEEEDDDDFTFINDLLGDLDEETIPEFTEKLNESLDMFRRLKNYN
jgi:hypothetical protein